MKDPTVSQFQDWRQIAIDKGLDRLAIEFLKTKFVKMCDVYMADKSNIRTVVEFTILVDQGREWNESINASGHYPENGSYIRKVGNLYPSVSDKKEKVQIVLLNFPKSFGDWENAHEWAKLKKLKPTNPREMFALVEQIDLQKKLQNDFLYVISTTECNFKDVRCACNMILSGSKRIANVDWLNVYPAAGYESDWFAFRK